MHLSQGKEYMTTVAPFVPRLKSQTARAALRMVRSGCASMLELPVCSKFDALFCCGRPPL